MNTNPNILFLFADDQSFETLRAFGSEVETPNLDRLAARGVAFTNTYNQGGWQGAICVASRTMLLTGRFLWHAEALEKSLDDEREAGRLWPQYLERAGYDTYMTGKWHIRNDPATIFKTTTHIRPGMATQTDAGYNRPIEGQDDPWRPWDPAFGGYWEGGKHWSEVLGDDAVTFIETAAQRPAPFFMYLAFNAPHDPRQSPREYVERYPTDQVRVPRNFLPEYPFKDAIGCGPELRDEALAPFPRTEFAVKVNRQEYYAIITHMDAQIGRILDALEASGKADNTYIFFTADNGLAAGHHGLMGKQNMFEHSMKVPMIVAGPGIPQNARIDAPVYLQDIMPTSLEIAGVSIPEHVQYKSLLPLTDGRRDSSYAAIYGAYLNVQRMVRKDHHKLIYYPACDRFLLFDLQTDPDEMVDLAAREDRSKVVADLKKELKQLQRATGDVLLIP